jgi:uncharacterized protein (TIGR01319 family)
MKALLIDFGSTFTKATLADLEPPGLIGTFRAPTTADTDLMDGFHRAIEGFSPEQLDGIAVKRASSSAAGGLKIAAVGLVPQLTVKAAREAALGAGARVVAACAYTLTEDEIRKIKDLKPDLLLLAGGTDGGDKRTILENAARIAESELSAPVVVAGNKAAAPQAEAILKDKVSRVVVTGNVMPDINVLAVEPARRAIRELYLQEITKAKGWEHVQKQVGLAMPTPLAVMKAGELCGKVRGEEIMIVDVGGATTDIHSFADGAPKRSGCILKGLPEPFIKRTVEGDLGMRVSLRSLLEVISAKGLPAEIPFAASDGEMAAFIDRVSSDRGSLARNEREKHFDRAFAVACIREALRRHAGTVTEAYTPEGKLWVQSGKDLTEVEMLIATGGALVFADDPGSLLKAGLRPDDPLSLTPRRPRLALDHQYTLYAVGLLADLYPEAAEMLLKETLLSLGEV